MSDELRGCVDQGCTAEILLAASMPELKENRKILPINGCLHSRRNVARLYVQSCTTIKTYQLQRIEKGRVA